MSSSARQSVAPLTAELALTLPRRGRLGLRVWSLFREGAFFWIFVFAQA
jgi:hypothetical protein